jgi:hypothetical protein
MTDCARCLRTLDVTEVKFSRKVRPQTGKALEIWCADCLLKSNPTENER